ncbi:MAG: fluoride efflux transporter CrcB [bacterium]
MLLNFLTIGIGGFLGSISRYLVYLGADHYYHKHHFPLGTLIVNATGSLLIGILFALSVKHQLFNRHSIGHFLFVTGFLGAYTTFSTFSQDNLVLIFEKNYMMLTMNILLNVFLGLGFVALGYFLVTKYY